MHIITKYNLFATTSGITNTVFVCQSDSGLYVSVGANLSVSKDYDKGIVTVKWKKALDSVPSDANKVYIGCENPADDNAVQLYSGEMLQISTDNKVLGNYPILMNDVGETIPVQIACEIFNQNINREICTNAMSVVCTGLGVVEGTSLIGGRAKVDISADSLSDINATAGKTSVSTGQGSRKRVF